MGTFTQFNKYNIAPKEATQIGVYNSSGTRVGSIPLGSLEKDLDTRGAFLYRVGLISDIHNDSQDYDSLSDETRNYWVGDEARNDFQRCLTYFTQTLNVDMICSAGDLGLQTLDSEFAYWQSYMTQYAPTTPAYTCTGNHDVYTAGGGNFKQYTRRTVDTNAHTIVEDPNFPLSFYFVKTTNTTNDIYIFFSMYSNAPTGTAYRTSDLSWLEGVLEANKDKRAFIFTHYFFPAYAGNLGRVKGATTGGMYGTSKGMGGNAVTERAFMNLLSTYPNAMWFSGHCHWKYNLQKLQSNANIDRFYDGDSVNGTTYHCSVPNGAWTVHLSSLSSPIDCTNYITTECSSSTNQVGKPAGSEAAYMDVYEKGVEFVAIDMNTHDTTTGITNTSYLENVSIANYWMDFIVQESGGGEETGDTYTVGDEIEYTTLASMSVGDSKYVAINSVSYNACQLGSLDGAWSNSAHTDSDWTNKGTSITDAQASENEATLKTQTQANVTSSNKYVFVLTKTSGGYTIKSMDGYYLGGTSTGTGSGTWTNTATNITISNATNTASSGAVVKQSNNDKLLRFTSTSNTSANLYFGSVDDIYWNANTGGWTIWYMYNVTRS